MRNFLTGALVVALMGAAVQPAEAQWVQSRAFGVRSSASGWLGVSLNARIMGDSPSSQVLVVELVMDDSPAQAAGIRTGDRILTINGEAVTLDAMELLRTEPGDRVRLTLERGDGETLDLELTSILRPETLHISSEDVAVLDVRLDSMTNRILQAADSLKMSFTVRTGGERNRVVLRGEPHVLMELSEGDERSRTIVMESIRDGEGFSYRWQVPEPQEGAPFGVFFRQNEETGELLFQRRELQVEHERTRRAEMDRQRQLMLEMPEGAREIDSNDLRLVALRETRANLEQEIQGINEQLARISLETLSQAPTPPGVVAPQVEVRVLEGGASVRRISPYIMADRFVAGAELATLNSALAQYFPVDEGVLVTEVVEGSPAATSGLEPGDVIVRVDDTEVTAIDELRQVLAGHGWNDPPTLTVVRQNEEVRLPLRR